MNNKYHYSNSLTVQRKVYTPLPYRPYHVDTGMEVLKGLTYTAGFMFVAGLVYFVASILMGG